MKLRLVACAAALLAACAPPERQPSDEETGAGGVSGNGSGGVASDAGVGGATAGTMTANGGTAQGDVGDGAPGTGGVVGGVAPGTGGMMMPPPSPPAPPPHPPPSPPPSPVANKTPPVVGSKEAGALRGAGLDPLALPSFVVADKTAHIPIMGSFTRNLGVTCEGCHATNLGLPTPNKKVAKHMWDDILVKLTMKDGSPLYCDSCHQGKALFLDRSNRASLEAWMQTNLVDKLARRDGAPHDCSTCHGNPPIYDLVDRWKVN